VKFIDLTNEKFGKWTVIRYLGHDNAGKNVWECECECGNISSVITGNLTSGKSTQCYDCARNGQFVDYSGMVFGELVAIQFDQRIDGKSYWICQCSCGKLKKLKIESVVTGHIKTCGHNFGKSRVKVGDAFGKLEVIKDLGRIGEKHGFLCRCECGKETISTNSDLLGGRKSSCGCLLSKGENLIAEILDYYMIYYERQKTFKECFYKALLRFDFFIPDYNLAIEFQGKQHYKKNCFNFDGYDDFEEVQIRDQIKRDYCASHNIKLIEIPYWDFPNISTILTQQLNLQ
jgi:hypothetical protein